MRVVRDDNGIDWSKIQIWYKEVEISPIVVAADDEEGWVDVQCPPRPKAARYYGEVRIEVEVEGEDEEST